ncbi:MAG: ABC transporter ATP-binding protein [Bacilli bacterium]|nr:ABC transporter ATP-binding protein [Bacilli bacterium]MDD4123896.1 ABC transporter ATP-binding protein [Bacilli bacterium]
MEVVLKNLSKHFTDRKGNVAKALNDLDVTIPSGKLIGLLGPSGCGKSTTLYLIAGLHKPTQGQIFFGDSDVTNVPPEKRGIGLVFQNYALYPHLTVRQNIMFPLENMKMPKDEAIKIAQEMADLVDIGKLMDRKPKELSGGQQQRVAIARALVKKPRVLLLDEPLSNLDARLRLQTREEIKKIQRETGITTIFVTHDQEEAMSISDEIILINAGVFQQMDHPQKVYDEPANLFVAKFLGNPAINIFHGQIKTGVLSVNGVELDKGFKGEDRNVVVGVRPEAFYLDNKGKIEINVEFVEHIGRDITVVGRVENQDDSKVRIIIPSDHYNDVFDKSKLGFTPKRMYIFEETGERIK